MPTNLKPLMVVLGITAFIVFLAIANLGGIGKLTTAGLGYVTSEADVDKNLKPTVDPGVLDNLGAAGNFIFAIILTVVTYGVRGIHNTAAYIDEKLTNWNTPAPSKPGVSLPVVDQTGKVLSSGEITDDSWDKAQAVLLEAIYEKDKRLTITLCERMASAPYLTTPDVPQASVTSTVTSAASPSFAMPGMVYPQQ